MSTKNRPTVPRKAKLWSDERKKKEGEKIGYALDTPLESRILFVMVSVVQYALYKQEVYISFSSVVELELAELIKVSKFQKQIFLFSFEPKIERNYFLNAALASKMSQIKKMEALY